VKTSDHKHQAHIFLEKARTLEERTRLQKLLQQCFGSDPASTDGNHARRLPNTINWKYESHPVVRVIREIKDRETPEQLIAKLEKEKKRKFVYDNAKQYAKVVIDGDVKEKIQMQLTIIAVILFSNLIQL